MEYLTSSMIAEWIVNHRHTDSNPEMLFRIIRNVDQLVVHEMKVARIDERRRCDQEWADKIEGMIENGSSYQSTLDRYTEVERIRICAALREILKSLLPKTE
jgi:hypothetical protein